MSRIGRTPIKLADDVKADISGELIKISGKLGNLEYKMRQGISVKQEENSLFVSRLDDSKLQKAYHGLARALINNMVIGVSEGYKRILHVIGTGYSAEVIGGWLKLNVGYSHEILMEIPESLKVVATAIPRREQGALGVQVVIEVGGINKEEVGKFAAEIRHCRPPAPNFKGKGIRWEGEHVRIVTKSSTQ
ncbi:MAG: 50S ribosomal protein L6 [Candidatus Cloacimonetes bacterium]|nr:50S ribosomal protein L6 [Candidatus Cloacimonadota bacterium]